MSLTTALNSFAIAGTAIAIVPDVESRAESSWVANARAIAACNSPCSSRSIASSINSKASDTIRDHHSLDFTGARRRGSIRLPRLLLQP